MDIVAFFFHNFLLGRGDARHKDATGRETIGGSILSVNMTVTY